MVKCKESNVTQKRWPCYDICNRKRNVRIISYHFRCAGVIDLDVARVR